MGSVHKHENPGRSAQRREELGEVFGEGILPDAHGQRVRTLGNRQCLGRLGYGLRQVLQRHEERGKLRVRSVLVLRLRSSPKRLRRRRRAETEFGGDISPSGVVLGEVRQELCDRVAQRCGLVLAAEGLQDAVQGRANLNGADL